MNYEFNAKPNLHHIFINNLRNKSLQINDTESK